MPETPFQKLTLTLPALLALLLTACMVGPDYQRPAAITSSKYEEAGPWKKAQPRDNEPKGQWWTVYHDPELSGLLAQVQISNQNVLVSEAQFREACATVAVERASLFPTIDASPAYTRSESAGITESSGGGGGGLSGKSGGGSHGSFSTYNFPASLSYFVDVWGSVRRSLEANKASAQASFAELENMTLSYQGELAQDYFTLRGQDAEEDLLKQTVANYQKNVELTHNLYVSGVDSAADEAQARAQLDAAKAQLIEAGVTRATSEHAIAVLTGHPPEMVHVSYSAVLETPPFIPPGVPSTLLERRPDIAQAERTMAADNAQIGVQEAAYYPQVTIGASSQFTSVKLDELFSGPAFGWSLGPVIAQTIFDGGKIKAAVQQAGATYDAQVATYRQTVLTAIQQVDDALSTLRIVDKELGAERDAIAAAQQSLDIVTNQYKAGTSSYLNIITAENTLLTDQNSAVSLQTRRLVASVQLIEALGGGFDGHLPAPEEFERLAQSMKPAPQSSVPDPDPVDPPAVHSSEPKPASTLP